MMSIIRTNNVLNASFWSIMSEMTAKIVNPIVFIILTRILSPEDFGIIAVATTILSFIYVINDMGISKVLIQESENTDYQMMKSVGFWLNTVIGTIIFIITLITSSNLSILFNEPKAKNVIDIMAIQILVYSLSSVQNAIKKKELDYKFLFYMRLITTGVPALISVPIAFSGGGYWAIVIGQVLGSLCSTAVLWTTSDWKPSFIFSFRIMNRILSKSLWSTIEQIFLWTPMLLDTYLISKYYSIDSLGKYTTSRTLFASVITLSLGAILPVLFSYYSSIKDNRIILKKSIMMTQKITFGIASLIGLLVYIYSNDIESIIFTNKWEGISSIYGIIFILMGFEYFYSVIPEALKSQGGFKNVALNISLSFILSIPILLVCIKYSLLYYVLVRSLLLYIKAPLYFYLSKKYLSIKFTDYINNCRYILIVFACLIVADLTIDHINIYYINENAVRLIIILLGILYILRKEKGIYQIIKNKIYLGTT